MCVPPAYMLLCIMGMTPLTCGFPLSLADDSDRQDEWAGLLPSMSLRDWTVQMLTAPDFVAAANSNAGLMREAWLSGPQSQLSEGVLRMEGAWPASWSSQSSAASDKRTLLIGQDVDQSQTREKRNLEMADDATSLGLKRNLLIADDGAFSGGLKRNLLMDAASGGLKRNLVVADDAAFREKSKLLTAMERQKWLNSYMQKMLVVN